MNEKLLTKQIYEFMPPICFHIPYRKFAKILRLLFLKVTFKKNNISIIYAHDFSVNSLDHLQLYKNYARVVMS